MVLSEPHTTATQAEPTQYWQSLDLHTNMLLPNERSMTQALKTCHFVNPVSPGREQCPFSLGPLD